MAQAQAGTGDKVQMHYTGRFADGTTFDSSRERHPLEFEIGGGQIIPGLERAVTGMTVGETKTVNVAAGDAYGQRDPQRVISVPRDQLPEDAPTAPGTQLAMKTPDGQQLPVVVTGADENAVTLDANHPLAGHDLTFDVELVGIA